MQEERAAWCGAASLLYPLDSGFVEEKKMNRNLLVESVF